MRHDETCARSGKWFVAKECREFSTDGTMLGAEIAHTMGTTDEEEILRRHLRSADVAPDRDIPLGQMDAEQADWDAEE